MFLTANTKKAFTKLKQVFIEAPILNHFDLEYHIQIKMNVSRYAIGEILSQLTSDDFGQWQPIAFFSKKMIPTETQYKIHDGELLVIVETFKIWRHYFKGCKHEILMLTNYNKL